MVNSVSEQSDSASSSNSENNQSKTVFKESQSPQYLSDSKFDQELSKEDIKELLNAKPDVYKHCKLVMERHDQAYARTLDEPTFCIKISGRENLSRSFPGDEVCVEILNREQHLQEAEDLDDAISVREMNSDHYQIGIHITDAASWISKDSEQDKFARRRGKTIYTPGKGDVAFMFSRDLSRDYLSLLPGKIRKVVSLLIDVNKKNSNIVNMYFDETLIRSHRRMSYEEADQIIQTYCSDDSEPLRFSCIEDCLAVAYRFSEVHRKYRLEGGWLFGMQAGQSRSHAMVEELMNLYNSAAAENLISKDVTRDLTPLRCHKEPDPEQLTQFKDKYINLIPMSPYFSNIYEVSSNPEYDNMEHSGMSFIIITSIFQKMEEFAQSKDYYSLMQLIFSDEIHPTLIPMVREFRDIQKKAVILRSCSSTDSRLGHYDLQLNAYTWASSPMRRYLDLILQRLLHTMLSKETLRQPDYTQVEINSFCQSGMDVEEKHDALVLKLRKVHKLKDVVKLAMLDQLTPQGHEFSISFPLHSKLDVITIMYKHLKVVDQPSYSKEKNAMTLRWKRRVYSFRKSFNNSYPFKPIKNVTPVSSDLWKKLVSAVTQKDWVKIEQCLRDMKKEENEEKEKVATEQAHYKELTMELKLGTVVQVQLGTELKDGFPVPVVQLLRANKNIILDNVDESLNLPVLNESQQKAVKEAVNKPFTVIQGPPGTGKTVVGIHIVYQFFKKNQDFLASYESSKSTPDQKPKKRPAILYCGPSNKSVDIVAEQLLKLKGVLKPLRIYCDQMEMREYPYTGSDLKLCRRALRDEKPKDELKDITLMYLVRKPKNDFSKQIKHFEEHNLSEDEIDSYRKLLKKAHKDEIKKYDVVLCTCSTALKPEIQAVMDFQQILIDECAMATEPEAFIPLVSYNPRQIVLLGDHQQIRPIVQCALVRKKGMQQSLFERYMDLAIMLDTQYRMHEEICRFPSKEFYEDKLKTGAERGPCYLLKKNGKPTGILFGHVQGKEDSLVVSTKEGNENSVANIEEAEQAVRVADLLVKQSGVEPEHIAILTPYNAQMSEIKKMIEQRHLANVSVCTIMKSQGSEWPYVIVSTVRSCSISDIKSDRPSKAWLGKRLGFITDPNQVNVAITRAQDGLCILGKQ
ncbi:hypothetical protein Q8A67_001746 [Cirrhinus molitorella]|uniref:RNB domain-containing protein n=1 Tax=Cirrhinus molitorella TaxID=172907 RepID=A0AA88Q4Q0_9TELE|nr:hypothetical protein Q8A67_001746 [Cirrhinus molitorella]